MQTRPFVVLSALVLLTCSGCVTGRRVVELNPTRATPANPPTPTASIVLERVVDARNFQNKPRDPSTPSVEGDVNALSDADRSRAIARQRNTYGKALGDVFLPDQQTVGGIVEDMFTRTCAQAGVKVVKSSTGAEAGTAVVEITEFWGWMTPGMFTIPFEAHVEARIQLVANGETSTLRVQGIGRNQAQIASNANWQLAYERAFADFQTKLETELRNWTKTALNQP